VRSGAGLVCAVMVVDAQHEYVQVVRGWVADRLDGWGMSALADDCRLVVSELVTNAMLHTCSATVGVTLERKSPTAARVAVTDGSWQDAGLDATCTDAESGRGLFLVSAVTDRMGVVRVPSGKAVWADVSAPGQLVWTQE
jgi:anti-sigma regulatory factor (Ser/Thr protein kinase)